MSDTKFGMVSATPRTIEIGTLVLTEPREYENHYETAAWFQKIRVEPGRYPVTANLNSPGGVTGDRVYWIHASLPGTIIDASFRSLWCGVPISDKDPGKDSIGQPGAANLHCLYGYEVAKALDAGRPIMGGTLELNDEWSNFDGEIRRTLAILLDTFGGSR